MVTDNQVRILMKLINQEKLLKTAAAKAGMSEKTARKYRKSGKLPSQCRVVHDWRTRPDPLDQEDWHWVEEVLDNNDGIEAKTLFEVLQHEHPGKYQDGQLRTFQRRVKLWRALKGPGNEVFFPQIYKPGEWCESDFTHMNSLCVTINGVPFDHMLYHFVLCYCNWETGTVCFSESYESLSSGLQNALWKLGGVPKCHRTDNLTSAVNKVGSPEVFTDNYRGLAGHYGFESQKIQPGCPNENGDIEQRHHRLKKAIDQALMLRGSRDFASRDEYEQFLAKFFDQLNSGRRERLSPSPYPTGPILTSGTPTILSAFSRSYLRILPTPYHLDYGIKLPWASTADETAQTCPLSRVYAICKGTPHPCFSDRGF